MGYRQWSQPYPHVDPIARSSHPPHGPDPTGPLYAPLVAVARSVARDGVVLLAIADFDYRELALNWHASARRVGLSNALLLAADAAMAGHLAERRVPYFNGSAAVDAWSSTRLDRHVQRVVMERHVAAAALLAAGVTVLLTDATSVFVRDPLPFLLAEARGASLDVLIQRDSYPPPTVRTLGCAVAAGFVFMAPSRALVSFLGALVVRGMVEFYLRWTNAVDQQGWNLLLKESSPTLELAGLASHTSEYVNTTTAVALRKRYEGCAGKRAAAAAAAGGCLRVGLLPYDRFPRHGEWAALRETAMVWHGPRTRGTQPFRGHRLRLDRYDEEDFARMAAVLKADPGLWAVGT